MDNDSSKSNVLELIADHMNNSTPMHLRSESDTEPSSASSTEVQSAEESYLTSKKPAANRAPTMSSSYPSQQAKTPSYPSQQAKGEIDVDTVPRSRSVSPVPPASRTTTSTSRASSPTVPDPRRQRRRRRQDRLKEHHEQREGQQQRQQQSGAQVRRANTLPNRTSPLRPASPSPPPSSSSDAVETKKMARSKTGPIDHMRIRNSVDVEMDESELDILKVVADRAKDVRIRVNDNDDSESGSSSSGGSSSSSSSGGISHYDEEVGKYMPGGEANEKGGAMTAVRHIMNDLSGNSIGMRDLKAGTSNAVVTLGATPAMAASVAGAYSAAPGVGYIRNDQFQAGVLGSTCASSATLRSSDVTIQYSCGGYERRSMADDSGKSVESAMTHVSQQPERPVISAVRVDEDDLELHIREQIASAAAEAEVVDFEKETEDHVKNEIEKVQRKYFGGAAVAFLFLIVAIVIAVVVSVTQSKGSGSLKHHPVVLSTLASVSAKGHLDCGLSKRDEDAKFHPEYEELWKGFNGDWCRAIAAAALDGDVSVTIHDVTEAERWEALANGTLDVLVVGTPASTESLHFDLDKEVPAIFSTPFLFDGVGVGGMPDVIKHCATTKGFENYLGCRSVRVCACQGSSALEVFQKILHPSQIVEASSLEELYGKFASGCCNMLATDWSNERAEVTVRTQTGYTGEYALGEALYSKQPYALATRKIQNDHPTNATDHAARESDPQVWSEFVDWVLQALIAAEQSSITQATSNLITETEVFGDKYRNAFKHAVAAVGNYGEIYERNMGHVVPRDGMNLIANGSTGLHYHRSIGDVTDFGALDDDGTLAAIKERGKLVCGVPVLQNKNFTLGAGEVATQPPARFLMDAPALEEDDLGGAGIDMEFCRALASSIFQGLSVTNADTDSCSAFNDTGADDSNDRVEFVFLENTADGYTRLNNGEIDVISGYRMTLQGDVREPTTGQGYTFSQPFFYGPVSEEEHVTANNRCMVTRQHDRQWSDFVQVVVMSLFYAEEHGIDQPRANSMPYVNLFGPSFKRMMKDSVFAVGNYGEVYERLVELYLQRQGGPNTLNAEADPQLCSFPGPII